MATEVLMPALSPTMTEGKIARWLKSEGDAVMSGDVLAEIETDKATMEVEAVDEGVLAKIVIPEGTDHVAVNTPIALIAGNGEDRVPLASTRRNPPTDTAQLRPRTSRARGRHSRRRSRPPRRRRSAPRRGTSRNIPGPPARSRCARRCATRSPRRCGATKRCF